MIQTQDLQLLYNTMKYIETKGESTKVMADCLRFIENKIKESQQEPVAPPVPEPMPRPRNKSEPVDIPAEPVVDIAGPDQAAE